VWGDKIEIVLLIVTPHLLRRSTSGVFVKIGVY
jgi:hypothetical protein